MSTPQPIRIVISTPFRHNDDSTIGDSRAYANPGVDYYALAKLIDQPCVVFDSDYGTCSLNLVFDEETPCDGLYIPGSVRSPSGTVLVTERSAIAPASAVVIKVSGCTPAPTATPSDIVFVADDIVDAVNLSGIVAMSSHLTIDMPYGKLRGYVNWVYGSDSSRAYSAQMDPHTRVCVVLGDNCVPCVGHVDEPGPWRGGSVAQHLARGKSLLLQMCAAARSHRDAPSSDNARRVDAACKAYERVDWERAPRSYLYFNRHRCALYTDALHRLLPWLKSVDAQLCALDDMLISREVRPSASPDIIDAACAIVDIVAPQQALGAGGSMDPLSREGTRSLRQFLGGGLRRR